MSIKHKKRASSRPRRSDYRISAIMHAVGRRWILVLCLALLFSALVAAFYTVWGAGYTAESLVEVRGPDETGANGISEERLEEIRDAAGAEKVSRSAMEHMGWESGISEFNRGLELKTGEGGELGVSFSAETPERAARAADAYAAAFVGRIDSLSEDRLAGGALNVRAEIVRVAETPRGSALRAPYAALLAFVPGLIIGGVLVLMLSSRDPRWRDTRDAEADLGAPVLGVIPERDLDPRGSETKGPARKKGDVVREP